MVSLKLKDDFRQDLYYKKYKFKAKFKLVGVNRTRYVNTFYQYKQRIESIKHDFPIKSLKNIEYDKIEKFIDWKKETKKSNTKLMIRVESDTCTVYSNDVNHFTPLSDFGTNLEYFQVNDNIPTGVMYFSREPKHKYRVYFKSKRVSIELKKTIIDLEERYRDTSDKIYLSVSLKRWLNQNWSKWTLNNFYIDYDQESTYTLLSLMLGEIFRANYKCVKKPKS